MTKLYEEAPKFALATPDQTLKALLIRNGMVLTSLDKADHVFFGGGADINPFLYGEKRHPTTTCNFTRDLHEINLLRMIPDDISKIGVCRGAQLLNVVLGNGRMYQNVNNHTRRHLIYDMFDNKSTPIMVTSVHHQMMIPGQDGHVLYAAKEATVKETANGRVTYDNKEREGIIDDPEVVYYADRNVLCWQPHPEYRDGACPDHEELFMNTLDTYFFDAKESAARVALKKAIKEERAS